MYFIQVLIRKIFHRNWICVIRTCISYLTYLHHIWGCDIGKYCFSSFCIELWYLCRIIVITIHFLFLTICKFMSFNLSSIVCTSTIGSSGTYDAEKVCSITGGESNSHQFDFFLFEHMHIICILLFLGVFLFALHQENNFVVISQLL